MKERWLEIYKEVYDDIESDAPVSPALTALVVLCKRVAKLEEERNEAVANHNNLKDVYEDAETECKQLRVENEAVIKRCDWTVLDNAKQRMAVDDRKRECADLIELIRQLNKVYEIDQCDHFLADEVRAIVREK